MTENDKLIQKVVVATDFSKHSDLAVKRGAQIAQQSGQLLHLLHVVHPLDIYPELMLGFDKHYKDYERQKHATSMEDLDQLAIQLRKDFNIKVKTAARIGRTHTQIAKYAKDESADLLIVGYRGESNLLNLIMGTTAFRVLQLSSCPVLVIKNIQVNPYNNVIAAIDLKPLSSQVVALACSVAPNANIELLHVFDLKQEALHRDIRPSESLEKDYRAVAMEQIDKALSKLLLQINNPNVSTMTLNGYIPEAICSRITDVKADLIILGKNDKSRIEEFLIGSVSKTIANMVACDVLIK
jgi:nucleotide-binding universal stress UspA family protein